MGRRVIVLAALALLAVSGFATPSASAAASGALPQLPSFELSVEVRPGAHLAPGFTFIDGHQTVQQTTAGPEIVDNRGRVVWFHPLPPGVSVSNFQVQSYRGEPVLTWWQGTNGNPAFGALAIGIGQGEDVIMNSHYKVIARIGAADGLSPDSHEFTLTPEGNALISGYQPVSGVNLTSVHGPVNGTVDDSIVREVDVKTGKVLLDWSALAHVPITDSHAAVFGTSPWDFFHVNSVSLAPNGNLLISARHMWALYEVDPHTGAIVSTIGGKESNWAFGPGAALPGSTTRASSARMRFRSSTTRKASRSDACCRSRGRFGCTSTAPPTRSPSLAKSCSRATSTSPVVRAACRPCRAAVPSSVGASRYLQRIQSHRRNPDAGETAAEAELAQVAGLTIPNSWQTYRVFKEPWQVPRPAGLPGRTWWPRPLDRFRSLERGDRGVLLEDPGGGRTPESQPGEDEVVERSDHDLRRRGTWGPLSGAPGDRQRRRSAWRRKVIALPNG